MSRDQEREDLANLDATRQTTASAEASLWQMVQSIHSEPPLRDWVTLESQPLCPWATVVTRAPDQREALVQLLLACPGEKGLLCPPWGLVVWQWPSRRIHALLDVHTIFQGMPAPLTSVHVANREFIEGVQNAIAGGSPIPLPPDPLPDLYRKLAVILPLPGGGAHLDQPRPESGDIETPRKRAPQVQPEVSPSQPAPPHTSVPALMTRVRDLIEESQQEALLDAWRQLYARMSRTGFSVAVAGEFNRGKSTLINRILGEDLLPTGDLPTTAMVARVLYGLERTLWHILPGPKRERKELATESWKELTAQSDGADPKGVVQIEVPHPWLKQTGIQFVDTPGAGDLTGQRAALAIDAIAHCDATLVVVSATMPLSLTERSFVDQHVLSRKMPRVAVVLTRLDQVDEPDRAELVRFVSQKLKSWAPQVELWCIHGPDVLPRDATLVAAGRAEVTQRLTAWAADPDHVWLRELQVLSQLKGFAEVLRSATATRLAALDASEEERRKACQEAVEALARRKLDWEELRQALETRGHDTEQWTENAVRNAKASVTETLTYEVEHAANPKEWWERDMPYRLRRELLILARSLNDALRQRIAQDATWLYGQVKGKFAWTLHLPEAVGQTEMMEPASGSQRQAGKEFSDLDQTRLWTRLGLGALTLSGFLFPGAALAARVVTLGGAMVGGLASEKFFKKKIEEQRGTVAQSLALAVDSTLAQGLEGVLGRLRSQYQIILKEAIKEETLWLQTQQKALLQANEPTSPSEAGGQRADLRGRLEKVDRLIQDLAERLNGGKA